MLSSVTLKDMGGSQRDNDSSPNLSFNDLKQKDMTGLQINPSNELHKWVKVKVVK